MAPSKPYAAIGNKLCIFVKTPMNGAVRNHIRAQTMHENMQIFCFRIVINSFVHVNRIACEHVVAIFDIIANVMPIVTYAISDTAKIKVHMSLLNFNDCHV